MTHTLRRAFAEFVGTALLLIAVVGSGIAAQRLSPHDPGLQLLENAAATGAALVAIILALGSVSGAHLNPLVTLIDVACRGMRWPEVPAYIAAQVSGAVFGAVIANLMFSLPALSISTKERSGTGLWLAEVVATFGLLLVIFGIARGAQRALTPFAVGAYITGAYFFTASTSFANPAVTVARMLSNTFAGIAPASVAPFIASQVVGSCLAFGSIRFLYQRTADEPDVHAPRQPDETGWHRGRLPRALFVCVQNAGRSQMAQAFWEQLGGQARSAGSKPASSVHPEVVAAMAELGMDVSQRTPRALTTDDAAWAEVVVTMGCGDACPLVPGRRYVDWELDDPAGQGPAPVRAVRDEIRRRVTELSRWRP